MADTGIRISISGTLTAFPASMDGRGSYTFEPPPVVRKNGLGEAITAGFSKLTWKWTRLSQTEMNFLLTTVLGGAATKSITANPALRTYNHQNVLTNYTSCIVQRPTWERWSGNRYQGVTLEIEQIV